jgi:hypothetical protein
MQEPCSVYGGSGSCAIGIQDLNCRKCEHLKWAQDQLALNKCPHSGEELEFVRDAWGRDSMMCELCDCFGFDPKDPRLPQ